MIEPTLPGEGGGPPLFQSTPSAPGGGVIKAVVKNRLVNNGEISARFVFIFSAFGFLLSEETKTGTTVGNRI